MLLLLALGCGPDIRSLYEEERKHALAIESGGVTDWQPDLAISIGGDALAEALKAAAQGALDSALGTSKLELPLGASAQLRPSFRVEKATLSAGQGCESCLHFDLAVRGDVAWSLGQLGGHFPGKVGIAGQIELVVQDGMTVAARLFRVGKVEFESADLGGLRASPSEVLSDAIREVIGKRLPAIPIADLASAGLPVRALRIRSAADVVRVEVLTDVPGGKPCTIAPPPADAFTLRVSEATLGGLLRREAFNRGTVAMETAVDPESITVEGTQFHIQLRLWRLVGSGWWRDYDVTGTLAADHGKIRLGADSVVETGASRGAVLVDPLAALFESKILEVIADNFDRTLPAHYGGDIGPVALKAVATGVHGEDHTLVVDGKLRATGGD